ncbi:hypothetical protein [Beijerinckia sp. L45]|uniref:TY-Chap domain-containing protein n=1 Tax=Beijerinckia sp. L45 TaxID=1641855 RepID=UPI00131D0A12|nr:hypothetical protein [Beijerinckia sp. L45]
MRKPSRAAVTALVLWTALAAPARAAPDPYREYLDKYRCPVADRLQRLYEAGDPAVTRDRFLVIELLEHKFGYVQCLFHDHETRLTCEAASGFWYDKADVPRRMFLAPVKIAALARLGFSTDDSHGNFSLDRPVPEPVDFTAIADLMLKALYDGYDARVDKTLTFIAPFAPGLTLACDPVG